MGVKSSYGYDRLGANRITSVVEGFAQGSCCVMYEIRNRSQKLARTMFPPWGMGQD